MGPSEFQIGTPLQMMDGSLPEMRVGLELANPQCHPLAFLLPEEGGVDPVDLIYREYCSDDCPLLRPTIDDIHAGRVHWCDAALTPFDTGELRSLRNATRLYSCSIHALGRFVEIGGELIRVDKLWPACAL